MKITIKTLQQKLFQIDIEPEDTVLTIKTKINAEHNHPVEQQKLIYSGKVLDDAKIVKDCHFKEKDFLVLMVSKPKATPAASSSAAAASRAAPSPAPAPVAPSQPSAPAPAPAPAPAVDAALPPPAPVAPAAPAAPVSAEASAGTDQAQAAPASSDTSFVTGSALETSINNMMEMGFPRDQVLRALRASFNNPDRAVEYLFNGIPEGLLAEAAPPPPAAAPRAPAATTPAAGGGSAAPAPAPAPAPATPAGTGNLFQMAQQQQQQPRGAGALGGGGLGGLGGLGGAGGAGAGAGGAAGGLDPAQAAALRQRVLENPALLQHAVQAIAQQNPAAAEYLGQNPDLLLQLLSGGAEGLEGEEGDMGEGGNHPGMQTIELTQEEMAAIQRLQDLGFSRQEAAEAYLACGKNEELAANFLFENNMDG